MTRFINAALIAVLAFFVAFAILVQVTGDGKGSGSRAGGSPTVSAVEATWQPGQPQELLLDLSLHNPSSLDASVATVTYAAEVEGDEVDSAVARSLGASPPLLLGKGDGHVRVPVDLPEDFVLTWWPDYMADAEAADLRIQGTLHVVRDDGERDVAFEWRSSWQGELAEDLSQAVANCGAGETDLCLEESEFFWKDGSLHADLTFRNPASHAVALRNTTFALAFGERRVVTGDVDLAQDIAPGGQESVGLALTFSPDAMKAWWTDHLARCETSPVALRMGLQVERVVEDADPGNSTAAPDRAAELLQWTFPASPFQTRFACSP